ncbi:MAG: hypothetical protein SCM96_13125 [Acidobacteriota bacterium]|nr:hypothetical protein [Acidobacteriota bacterium]
MAVRKKRKIAIFAAVVLAAVLSFPGCAMMEDLAGALTNLQRLKFKLGAVEDFSILGIPLSGKANMADFSFMDGLRLLDGFRTRQLPAEFILNVLALNPNDGTGGSPRTVSTLTSLESRLLIDGTPTVTGNIERPVEIPGTGQDTTIPIRLTIDLYEFFGNKGYEEIIGLALALGGARKSTGRLSLDALPRVSTPYGDIAYPNRIVIVDQTYR